MVPHLWANQSQPTAKNSTGSFYYEGRTIYSYGSHFPIAEHVTNHRGERGVIFTRATRSVTTSGHVSRVRSALHGLPVPVFSVATVPPYGGTTPEDLRRMAKAEVESYKKSVPATLLRIARARSDWSRDYDTRRLSEAAQVCNDFARFAGYRGRVAAPKDLVAATLAAKSAAKRETARQARERAAAEVRRAEQARIYAERQAADAVLWQTEAAEWRNGERQSLRHYPGDGDGGTFLRLTADGLTVETSRGAEIPATEARRLLALILAVRKRGETWEPSGLKAEAFGGFPVRSVAADGALEIGCHSLPWTEIERFAVSVGWCAPGCAGQCEPPCPGCGAPGAAYGLARETVETRAREAAHFAHVSGACV